MEISKSKTKKKTLLEFGAFLPLGIEQNGTLSREVAVRPWRLKEEKELSTIFDEKGAKMDRYVMAVLSTMFTRIGPHDFAALVPAQKQVAISQMFMADVFFAYLFLRVQAMGNELTFDLTCPKCREQFPFTVDLNTVEIRSVEKLADASWDYKVRTPFPVRSKKVLELRLSPPRWSALQEITELGMNPGVMKSGMISGSITGIKFEGGKDFETLPLAKHELDEMTKYDLEKLTTSIDEASLGPDMSIEVKCSKCRNEYKTSIEWTAESFFGISSRSEK